MPKFRILSLDGGGIRGAFIAGFLAELERQLGRPIIDYFDLIAGTSTGGIIAVALAMGESAKTIESFYRDRGAKAFTRPNPIKLGWWRNKCISGIEVFIRRKTGNLKFTIDRDWLFQPKYTPKELLAAMTEIFRHRTLEEAHRRLVIPSVNLVEGKTVVFKTAHAPDYVRDRAYRAVDVVLATTAAPTYFPPATINTGSAYADGGLWANNPAICAYAEAVNISQKCRRPGVDPEFTPADVEMLSVGTGTFPYFLATTEGQEGSLHWLPKLLDVMGGAQSQGTNFQACYLLGEQRLKRVNFELPEKWALDAVEHINRFIHIGHEKATAELADFKRRFPDASAKPFTPFPG